MMAVKIVNRYYFYHLIAGHVTKSNKTIFFCNFNSNLISGESLHRLSKFGGAPIKRANRRGQLIPSIVVNDTASVTKAHVLKIPNNIV